MHEDVSYTIWDPWLDPVLEETLINDCSLPDLNRQPGKGVDFKSTVFTNFTKRASRPIPGGNEDLRKIKIIAILFIHYLKQINKSYYKVEIQNLSSGFH